MVWREDPSATKEPREAVRFMNAVASAESSPKPKKAVAVAAAPNIGFVLCYVAFTPFILRPKAITVKSIRFFSRSSN